VSQRTSTNTKLPGGLHVTYKLQSHMIYCFKQACTNKQKHVFSLTYRHQFVRSDSVLHQCQQLVIRHLYA